MMKERGVEIGVNTIRNIAQRFSERARMEKICERYIGADSVKNRRIVVSTDGGRVRIRKNKKGPKTEKGRTRYKAEWKDTEGPDNICNRSRRKNRQEVPAFSGRHDGRTGLCFQHHRTLFEVSRHRQYNGDSFRRGRRSMDMESGGGSHEIIGIGQEQLLRISGFLSCGGTSFKSSGPAKGMEREGTTKVD